MALEKNKSARRPYTERETELEKTSSEKAGSGGKPERQDSEKKRQESPDRKKREPGGILPQGMRPGKALQRERLRKRNLPAKILPKRAGRRESPLRIL